MSDKEAHEPATPEVDPVGEPDVAADPGSGGRPWWRRPWARLGRYSRWTVIVLVALAAAGIVSTVTVDLGPVLRARAEGAFANYIDRPVHIGRFGMHLLPGRFVIEDLVIEGLSPDDRPFFRSERIVISTAWLPLLRGEFLVDAVDMQGWRMVVEAFDGGRHTFPRFAGGDDNEDGADDEDGAGAAPDPVPAEPSADAVEESARRFVTTVQYLRAHDGEFVYDDHGAPWSVVARNIDLRLAKALGYGGQVSFSDGTVQIGDFEPMTTGMQVTYSLDGGLVDLTRIDLQMDGFDATMIGQADLLGWPEGTFHVVESSIDLPTMKDIFFADDDVTFAGEAAFTGTHHVFDGGRETTGTFTSGNARLQGLDFPTLDGDLIWTRDRFELTRFGSGFYGGDLDLTYAMQPLGAETPGFGTLDTRYRGVALDDLLAALEIAGARPQGTAAGRTLLRWPLGRFADLSGDGELSLTPPEGTSLLPRGTRPSAGGNGWRYAVGAFDPASAPWRFALGGELNYTFGSDGVDLQPSWAATPLTAIEFEGRTAWGRDSHMPFRVVSADWQESNRLMASIMTAFGRPTGDIALGGHGAMDGVMRGAFLSPRIEARFDGDDVRAWNVDWGHGEGDIVFEDGYLDVADGVFHDGVAGMHVDGRFALGRPQTVGEEINARFGLVGMPAQHVRDAFALEGYTIDGPLDGDIHLFGAYGRPHGYGTLALGPGVAYGEPFDSARAGLRFEGDGVRLDGLDVRKGDGQVTGAMFIRWDGTYSVNADGRDLDLATVQVAERPGTPLTGSLRFTVTGAGAFDAPRYDVRGTMSNLTIGGAEVGQLTGRLNVDNEVLQLEVEGASPSLAVSGSGRVALTTDADAELRFRVSNTNLDPFIRAVRPDLPEATSVVASGTLVVEGPLREPARLSVDATIEQLDLALYDYAVANDGPVRLSLDGNVVRLDRMRLEGDGTQLELRGEIDLDDGGLSLEAEGGASLGILQGFFPDLRSTGNTQLTARISGSLRDPVLTGEARVTGGRLRHFSLPHSLDAIDGRVVFEPGGVVFDDLTASFGGGRVEFGGRLGVQDFALGDLAITARGTQMALRYPAGIRSTVDVELTLRGSVEEPTLGGTVNVRDAVLLELFDLNTSLISFQSEQASPVTPVAPTLPLQLDLSVRAPSSLRISDTNTQIVASAELTLRGTYDRPVLLGNADIERGQFYFEGNRYRVTRGSISLSNPVETEPFFDVEVETDRRVPGQTYRITIGLTGTMDRLASPELSSDPPLQQFEIIGLLLGDVRDPQQAEIRTLRAREASQQELLQAAGARLLTTPFSTEVGGVVERSFGVDSFEIVPSLDDPTAQHSTQLIPTARLLIGQRISDRAHVTFSRALSGANQDVIMILEYDASDRLSWVLSQNEDRTYALDFRVRHAF